MASVFLCSFTNHHSLLYALGAALALAAVACFLGLSILLTSATMIVPAVIFMFSKQNQKSAEELVWDGSFSADQELSFRNEDDISKAAAAVLPEKEEGSFQLEDSISQGCLSTRDQDPEVEWPFQDKILTNRDWSDGDGSISDEESLIEISLPGGHFVSPYKDNDEQEEEKEEEIKRYNNFINVPKVFPNFISGSFCKQQYGLMKLLAELNEIHEEENLIEIDISMGSIKCPRFEIEA